LRRSRDREPLAYALDALRSSSHRSSGASGTVSRKASQTAAGGQGNATRGMRRGWPTRWPHSLISAAWVFAIVLSRSNRERRCSSSPLSRTRRTNASRSIVMAASQSLRLGLGTGREPGSTLLRGRANGSRCPRMVEFWSGRLRERTIKSRKRIRRQSRPPRHARLSGMRHRRWQPPAARPRWRWETACPRAEHGRKRPASLER
jgi:hypothetical protein